MILYDYLFPLIIVLIILGCLIYFRNSKLSIKEDFNNKIELSDNPTRIYGNLFSGYGSRSDSDAAVEEVNELISKNPEKFKHLDTRKPNIYINGGSHTKVNTIVLGNSSAEANNNKITKANLDIFNKNIHEIPEFRNGVLSRTTNTPIITQEPVVYYNNDSGPTFQNKLCIRRGNDTKCIEPRHLDMINGNMLIQFKIHDNAESTNGEAIESYNLEYGERDGFENVVQRTFYMKPSEHTRISGELNNLSTCYTSGPGRRDRHIITPPYGKAGQWNGKFYINPQDTNNTNYSHIHRHKHE